jgi:hypothetical protein
LHLVLKNLTNLNIGSGSRSKLIKNNYFHRHYLSYKPLTICIKRCITLGTKTSSGNFKYLFITIVFHNFTSLLAVYWLSWMCGLNLHPKLLIFFIIIDPITTVFIGLVILFYIFYCSVFYLAWGNLKVANCRECPINFRKLLLHLNKLVRW